MATIGKITSGVIASATSAFKAIKNLVFKSSRSTENLFPAGKSLIGNLKDDAGNNKTKAFRYAPNNLSPQDPMLTNLMVDKWDEQGRYVHNVSSDELDQAKQAWKLNKGTLSNRSKQAKLDYMSTKLAEIINKRVNLKDDLKSS